MRHLVRGRKLGRTQAHRKATLQALSIALIREHRIQTTVPKAKELRRFIEPLITRAKSDTMHNRREVFSVLQNKLAVKALFEEIAPQVGDRPGGYTRVLKTGFRSGDAAEMALIELVDFNLADGGSESADKKKRTRRSRSGKGTTETATAAAVTETGVTKKAATEKPTQEIAEAEVVEAAEIVETAEVAEEAVLEAPAEKTAEEPIADAAQVEKATEEVQSEVTAETESEKKDDSASDIEEEKA